MIHSCGSVVGHPCRSNQGCDFISILPYKNLKVKVTQLCPTLCDPMDYTVHGILQARILKWVAVPFSRGSSQPRDQTTLQVDSLPAEPQGKPRNTGVGSLSLLQRIFPTQESNWGLLHYRQILYQLNYQGSPHKDLNWRFLVEETVNCYCWPNVFNLKL